jgi:hypothetical protein
VIQEIGVTTHITYLSENHVHNQFYTHDQLEGLRDQTNIRKYPIFAGLPRRYPPAVQV